MKKILTLIIIVSIFTLGVAKTTHAQFSSLLPADINLDLIPETPGANQNVTATISSFSTDLDASSVSWIVNGRTIKSGKGIKVFSFTTGPSNTTTKLTVNVTTANGESIVKNYSFKPSNVDLIWQAYGYVPPFYKGKTLFSHQDMIQFIALPHIIGSNGIEVPANNLIYKWTRNGTVLGDFSGYGKSTYTMIASVISRPLEIDVEVTSPNSDDIAQASITAPPIDPLVLFYQNDPLYGIQFQKALQGNVVMTNEINVLVAPFFFDLGSYNGSFLSYKWSLNNSLVDTDYTKASRVFRPKAGTYGITNISVSIENSDKMLQTSSGNFNIQFNNSTTQNSL